MRKEKSSYGSKSWRYCNVQKVGGTEIKVNGKDMLLVKQEDVLAVIVK